MHISDNFGTARDEVKQMLTYHGKNGDAAQEMFLNEEHEMKLFGGGTLLHTFVCSPRELGELAAGWLYTAGYDFDAVTVDADGRSAVAEGIFRGEKRIFAAPALDVSTQEMLMLFAQASDKYARSHGIHECVIKGKDWHILRTDIGRHNAIDKAVGAALAAGKELAGAVMFSSGRINEQTVEKAVQCGIGCLMSKAVITRSALELAEKNGLSVLFSVKSDGYCTR